MTVEHLRQKKPSLWINPKLSPADETLPRLQFGMDDIRDASDRLRRFAPLLSDLFEDTRKAGGIIESKLTPVPMFQQKIGEASGIDIPGNLLVKEDHALPVAGSIKARGGIYEVLCLAEELAEKTGILQPADNYRKLAGPEARRLYEKYTVTVGSTGNLGLSIGITAAALGFNAVVHMSSEAKKWKKELLRSRGVSVIEHKGDYGTAVQSGREAAAESPRTYFVDDEHSVRLFLGYAVAALRLRTQLQESGIQVDMEHPLFVYIPCGVGGAPGGICFGLKLVFGDAVHCFFAEPLEAPCMQFGFLTDFDPDLSIYDLGLTLTTAADGLAVGKASSFVGKLVEPLVSGCYTTRDEQLFRSLYLLMDTEGMKVEPSAAAGCAGPFMLLTGEQGKAYLRRTCRVSEVSQSTHIIWSTGGSFLPEKEYRNFYRRGR